MLTATAALAGACASSGAVPHPFPMPPAPAAPPPAASPSAAAERPRAAQPPDRDAIVATALSLRGLPYRNGGSDPSGFDCSGFTQYVFARHGIVIPRDVREQFQSGKAVKSEQVAPGDLLFFTTTERGASHVAIALGGDEFVHAPSSKGVVRVEHVSAAYWAKRYLGARRVDSAVVSTK